MLVTDRLCEREEIAKKHGYESKRIPYSLEFDFQASIYLFEGEDVHLVILLYSHLISEILFKISKLSTYTPKFISFYLA